MNKCLPCAPGSLSEHPGGRWKDDCRYRDEIETGESRETVPACFTSKLNFFVIFMFSGRWENEDKHMLRTCKLSLFYHHKRKNAKPQVCRKEGECKKMRYRAEGGVQEDFDGWSDSCVPGECLWRTRGSLEINALIVDVGKNERRAMEMKESRNRLCLLTQNNSSWVRWKASQLSRQRLWKPRRTAIVGYRRGAEMLIFASPSQVSSLCTQVQVKP